MRVAANNMYSCLMQKTQRFSSLFRHYSKHHGLPRESLDFFFTVRSPGAAHGRVSLLEAPAGTANP